MELEGRLVIFGVAIAVVAIVIACLAVYIASERFRLCLYRCCRLRLPLGWNSVQVQVAPEKALTEVEMVLPEAPVNEE